MMITRNLRTGLVVLTILALSGCNNLFKSGLGDSVDIEPPTVTIASHVDGDFVGQNESFGGAFGDDLGTPDLQLSLVPLASDGTSPTPDFAPIETTDPSSGQWTFDFDTTQLTDGEHELRVRATDSADRTTDAKLVVRVDNKASVILVTNPGYGPDNVVNGTITITGEAYDVHGVRSVELSVTANPSGGDPVTVTDTAVGTTVWSYTLNTEAFSDTTSLIPGDGSLEVMITATDRAGNVSTSLYHAADLREALGTVPSAEEIARVITGSTLQSSSISGDQLNAIDSFQLLIDQSLDDVQYEFINPHVTIADTTLSGPVATDGAALLPENSTATGAITDDDGVQLGDDMVQIRIVPRQQFDDAPWQSIPADQLDGSGRRVNWSWPLTGLDQGVYYLMLRAKDYPEEDEDAAEVPWTESAVNEFVLDFGPPSLREEPETGQELVLTSSVNYRNSDVPLTGVATDGNGVTSLTVQYSKDGGVSQTLLVDTVDDGQWATVLPVSLGDGAYEITVVAEDTAGQTRQLSGNVVLDTTSPTLEVTAPAAAEQIDSGSYTMRGRVTDGAGQGVAELAYSLDSTDGADGTWTDVSLTGLNWSVTGVDFGVDGEGSKILWVRAGDGLNEYTTKKIDFYYDLAPPTLSASLTDGTWTTSSESEQITSSDLTFEGDVSDNNGIESIVISARKDGSPWSEIWSRSAAGNFSRVWNVPGDGSQDGKWEFAAVATDVAERTAEAQWNVRVDTTAPDTPTVASIAGAYVENALSISGITGDSGSGVRTVEWSVDYTDDSDDSNDTWTAATGTTNWYKNDIPIDSGVYALPEGTHTVHVRATDGAGNVSAPGSRDFVVDRDNPEITVAGYSGDAGDPDYRNGEFTISGTIQDTLTLSNDGLLTVSATRDGAPIDLSGYPISVTGSGTSRDWEQVVPDVGDGTYEIGVVGRDAAGRSVSWNTVVKIDRTGPEITVDDLADGDMLRDTARAVSGTATDAVSNVQKVEYRVNAGPWTTVGGTTSWTASLSGLNDGLDQTIDLRSIDSANNESPITTITFSVDTENPVLDETTSGITGTSFAYRNSPVSLGGPVSDANGIANVTVMYQKDGGATETLLNDNSPGDPWSVTLPAAGDHSDDGSYEITIEATDNAGFTSLVSRNIVIDTTKPSLTVTGVQPGDSIGGRIVVDERFATVSGQATDDGGRGVTELQYSLDSTDGSNGSWTDISIGGFSWSASGVDMLDLNQDGDTADAGEGTEGSRTLWVRAGDGLNGYTTEQIGFDYDTAPPTLTETAIGTDTQQITRADVTLSGSASDTNGLNSVVITAARDGASEGQLFSTASAGAWSYTETLPGDVDNDGTGDADGEWVYTITAEDVAGRTTTVTRRVLIDETAPAAPVIAAFDGSYQVDNLVASGTANDGGSDLGAGAVEYSFDEAAWSTVGGTSSWFSTIDIAATGSDLVEGDHTLYVRATDRAGNVSATASRPFIVDRADPVLVIDAAYDGTVYRNGAGFTINGAVTDTLPLGAAPIDVTAVDSLGDPVDLSADPVVYDADGPDNTPGTADDGSWSRLIAAGDGTYTVTITATDAVGRTTRATRTVIVDTQVPTVAINAVADYVSGTIPVSGTSSDPGTGASGVAEVWYRFDGGSWTQAGGVAPWSANLDLSAALEADLLLEAYAVDRAGNQGATASTVVQVDRANPRATETQLGSTLFQTNGDVTLSGIADDAAITADRAASSVVLNISKDGADPVQEVLYDADADPTVDELTVGTGADEGSLLWSYTLEADPNGNGDHAADGFYSIELLVTDVAGKVARETRSIQIDTTGPTLVVSAPQNNESTEGNLYTISGTSRDTGGVGFDGTADVEYSLDGGTWTELSLSGTSWGGSGTAGENINLGATEGSHSFAFRSTDKVGNVTTLPAVTLYYDKAAPEFGEFAVDTTDTQFTNQDITFEGFAYDSNALQSVTVAIDGGAPVAITPTDLALALDTANNTFTAVAHGLTAGDRIPLRGDTLPTYQPAIGLVTAIDPTRGYYVVNETVDTFQLALEAGGAAIDFVDPGSNLSSNRWSYTFAEVDHTDGLYPLVFTATDIAGKTTTATRAVRLDTSAPTLSVDTDLTGWKGSTTLPITGIAGDDRSGVTAVEYQVNGGSWNLVTGTSSWSGTVNFVSGSNDLTLRARDRAGNVTTYGPETVKVDITAPAATVTSPSTLVKLNGQSDLPVTVGVDDAHSGVVELLLRAGSNDFSSGTVSAVRDSGTAASGTWTAAIPAADILALEEGQRTVYFQATDAVGNARTGSFSIFVDKTVPNISVTSPVDGATVNKTITISGTASDLQGLDDTDPVTVEVWNTTLNSNAGGWEAITRTGSFNWSAEINTVDYDSAAAGTDYDVDGVPPGVQLQFRATALDEAGNTASVAREITLDQDSDRPVVDLSNIDVAGTSTLKLTRTIYGTVQDDDGTLSSFSVSLDDGTSWTPVTVSGGSWSYDIPGGEGDGEKTLSFQATDAAGTIFTTTAAAPLDRPRLLVDDTPTYSDGAVAFRLDTVTPEIDPTITVDRTDPYTFVDGETVTTNMPFGGTAATFTLRVRARDANGIGSVSVSVPGADGTPFTETEPVSGVSGDYEVFETVAIDVSGVPDGSVDVQITVTDSSGLTATATRTIIVDNTAPTITYLSPLQTQIVNGDIEVRGTASDDDSGLAGVEYKIGYNHATEAWTAVSGSLFSWTIALTGADRIDQFAGRVATVNPSTNVITIPDHGFADGEMAWVNWIDEPTGLDTTTTYYIIAASQDTFQLATTAGGAAVDIAAAGTGVRVSNAGTDTDNNGIWSVPVLLRVTDNATNALVTTETDYVLQVDPSGDIPNVSIVYPDPDAVERTFGGNIRIFGTSDDDDGVQAVSMQVDVNGDGVYDAADLASNGTNWYNGGAGQLVSGTVSWNRTINVDGEFNPVVDGPDPRPINFRVRAQDVNGLFGPWSASQSILVDDNVPQIGSSAPLTLVEQGSGATQAYIADRWLKGAWNLTGSVEDESGIATVQITGDINGSLAGNPGWFAGPDVNGNYTFNIPVTDAGSSGRLSFTITATDQSDPAQQTSTVVSVQADNQAPASNAYTGETPIVQSNLSYTLESSLNETGSGFGRVAFFFVRRDKDGVAANDRVYAPMSDDVSTPLSGLTQIDGLWFNEGTATDRPDMFTLTDAALIGNENVRVGGLIRIGGLNRRIVTWDSGTGTITWADEVDTAITSYGVAYAMVVDNETIETPVYSGNALSSITNDDGDGMVESIERSGGLYSWTASIDSKNVPDGPIEIHWVSFDEAGNYVADSVSTSIANNRPLLAGVTLGTDLDGDGSVGVDEKEPAFTALDPQGNAQQMATVSSGSFVAKGVTSVDIDVVGGNGELFYDLSVAGVDERTLQQLRAAAEPTVPGTIDVTTVELGADTVGGATKDLLFTIWDSTEETVPGTNSLSAALTVPIQVDLIDEVAPKVAMSPFFWNGSSDNSLYENSRENGHIEITGVVNGTDPDVSGQISVRGTAYDDQRLTSLWMAIDGFGFTGAAANSTTFDTNADGVLETLTNTYNRVATFSGGIWTGTDQWTGEGWKFTVTTEYLNQNGHKVNWQLDWDSSRVTGVAVLDVVARMIAVDKRGGDPTDAVNYTNTNASSETANLVPGDITANNEPSYQFDVVPYISGISTDLTGVRDRNIRGSTGKYAIQYSDDATDTITISGFNLAPVANGVRVGPDTDGIDGATLQGQPLTIVSETTSSVTVRKDATGSGYVSLVAQDLNTSVLIPTPNNVNADIAYNEEPSSEQENPTLTDDRFITVFDVFDTGFVNGYWQEMLMDGDYPVFGFIDDSAADDLQFSRGRVTGETGIGGTANTTVTGLIRGLGFQYYAMARDEGNVYHQLSSSTFNSMQQYYIYGEYATDYANNYGATQVYWGWYGGNRADQDNNDALVLDELDYDPGLLVGRYKNPRLLVTGDSTAAEDASLYMSFFDSNAGEIIFRNMQVGPSPDGGITRGFRDTRGVNMNELTDVTLGDDTRHTVTGTASQYFDMGLTDDNVVVIVYYNQTQSRLELVYSTTTDGGTTPESLDGADPAQAVYFSNPVAISGDFVGSYVSMAIETDGNPATDDPIHIATHDSSTADLSYIRIPAYNRTGTADIEEVTVDASLSVGIWTDIAVQNGRPYIGYYNNSQTGTKDSVKVAWFLGDASVDVAAGFDENGVTGAWEFYTVPANDAPEGGIVQFTRVSIGFDTTGNPVVGYLADDLEYARILPDL